MTQSDKRFKYFRGLMKHLHDFLKSNLLISPTVELKEAELSDIIEACSSYINGTVMGELKHHFQNKYKMYSLTIDCLIYWNLILIQILFSRYPPNKEHSELSDVGYFNQVLITLTNNLIALKFLFENGLDTQAKTVFRHSIELSDLALVVLHDKDFYQSHSSPQLSKKGNPFVSPKNNTIASKAKEIIVEFHGSGYMERIWQSLRIDQYEVLSELSHGNYLHTILNSYKHCEDSDHFIPSIGGGKWKDLDRVLSDICLHQVTLKRHITWMLDKKHDLNLFDNKTTEHRFIFYLDCVIAVKLLPNLYSPQVT